MKYRERPRLVEATQWFKNGDHPGDGKERIQSGEHKGELVEGKVVRYYRKPGSGGLICDACQLPFNDHGWIDSGGEGQTVCPGDFVISARDGTRSVMKAHAFIEQYTKDHG